MLYSYNKLWKILSDHNITKTEMRKQVGISTNILAKMGKGEPVSMDTLAKICLNLKCSIENIVEISSSADSVFIENKKYGISNATVRNWEKLNTKIEERLTTRANKRRSKKRIIPLEYITNKNNVALIQEILDYIDENKIDIYCAILSLGISLLKKVGIYEKRHIATVLCEYSDIAIIDKLSCLNLPTNEFDILGAIYQSYLQEGNKNITGSYYTPPRIAANMIKSFNLSQGKTFLDPCCGSGSFLLTIPANNPTQIFGVDNDKIAVLISKINLLIKYKDYNFIPQVYCFDFLMGNSVIQQHPIFEKKFDYIATNPPWGAMNDNYDNSYHITSKETFSYFFVKAYTQLKDNGIIRFLFPEAILNVKVHKDIREFILTKTCLISITKYNNMFSGVTTKYIDIECQKSKRKDKFNVYEGKNKNTIDIKTIYETENQIFNLLSNEDLSIIRTVKNKGKYSLQNSVWALGIVTGNNKEKLSLKYFNGMEKIYTGKEIQPYILKPAKHYIIYDREHLQQVAKDEIYRTEEKLVYKFISNRLIFAYDNNKSLFLNSANILIPNIPLMSIKTVMAFLNSSLFQYIYMKLFGEVKILKGNLIELPFPQISKEDNEKISLLVEDVLNGKEATKELIEKYIFSIYDLTENQINYIRSTINGNTN